MQAKELRIGNWVLNSNGQPMFVDAIFRDMVYLDFEGNEGDVYEESIKDIKHIKLTEDLLVEFGYKFQSEGYEVFEQIWIKDYHRLYEHSEGFTDETLDKEIESVHQLQNIYYIIEEKELDIKL